MAAFEVTGFDSPEDMDRKLNLLKIITHSRVGTDTETANTHTGRTVC